MPAREVAPSLPSLLHPPPRPAPAGPSHAASVRGGHPAAGPAGVGGRRGAAPAVLGGGDRQVRAAPASSAPRCAAPAGRLPGRGLIRRAGKNVPEGTHRAWERSWLLALLSGAETPQGILPRVSYAHPCLMPRQRGSSSVSLLIPSSGDKR